MSQLEVLANAAAMRSQLVMKLRTELKFLAVIALTSHDIDLSWLTGYTVISLTDVLDRQVSLIKGEKYIFTCYVESIDKNEKEYYKFYLDDNLATRTPERLNFISNVIHIPLPDDGLFTVRDILNKSETVLTREQYLDRISVGYETMTPLEMFFKSKEPNLPKNN